MHACSLTGKCRARPANSQTDQYLCTEQSGANRGLQGHMTAGIVTIMVIIFSITAASGMSLRYAVIQSTDTCCEAAQTCAAPMTVIALPFCHMQAEGPAWPVMVFMTEASASLFGGDYEGASICLDLLVRICADGWCACIAY